MPQKKLYNAIFKHGRDFLCKIISIKRYASIPLLKKLSFKSNLEFNNGYNSYMQNKKTASMQM